MINHWLSYAVRNPNGYATFRLIDVTELQQPNTAINEFLAKQIIESYRNLEFLKMTYRTEPESELVKYIKDYVISSEKNTFSRNVWQGDFGEVIASLIVSYFEGLTVPLKKLRFKFNKERSVFCTDMIAHDSPITQLHYYEIKTRVKFQRETIDGNRAHVTIHAHNSLLKDEQAPNEFIADFLSRLHFEDGNYEDARKYSEIVKDPAKYKKNFELFFIVDSTNTIQEVLDDLEQLPPTLDPLRVSIVLIKNLGRLIVQLKQEVIEEAKKYVYQS